MLKRFWRFLRPKRCIHKFRPVDLKMIAKDGPERVEWPCCKCGKIFRAHCGLDITPKHGSVERPYINL